MAIRLRHKITAWLLIICLVITLIPDIGHAAENNRGEETVSPDEVTMEDVIEKTEDTTTYDLGGGQKLLVFHGGEVRYENDEGELVDCDPSLVKLDTGEKSGRNESLNGYAYKNKEGDKKQYFPETLSESTPILMENGDYSMSFTPVNAAAVADGGTENEATVEIEKETIPSIYEAEKKLPIHAVYSNDRNSADFTYTSGEYGVKETITLKK